MMSGKINAGDVDVYKRGALVSGVLEELCCLNLDSAPVYDDFYTVQVPVMVGGAEVLMEVRFQRVVSGARRAYGVPIMPSVSEVIYCCAALGDMVRIAVEPKGEGERGKGKGESAGIDAGVLRSAVAGLLVAAESNGDDPLVSAWEQVLDLVNELRPEAGECGSVNSNSNSAL